MSAEHDAQRPAAAADAAPARPDDAAWLAAARQHLDAAAAQLTADQRARLHAARLAAVAEAERQAQRQGRWAPQPWLALAGSAATVVLAVALWSGGPDDAAPELAAAAVTADDLAWLLEAEEAALASDLDLLEDLEFMAWVEQELAADVDGGQA